MAGRTGPDRATGTSEQGETFGAEFCQGAARGVDFGPDFPGPAWYRHAEQQGPDR
ncbi:MAG: hypothetical protein ACK4RN_02295 [Pseudorhodobacter sp.]